ncbi:MAG: hypothetical protein ACXVAG_08505 [Vulcanimicrobiaceae bacterium]
MRLNGGKRCSHHRIDATGATAAYPGSYANTAPDTDARCNPDSIANVNAITNTVADFRSDGGADYSPDINVFTDSRLSRCTGEDRLLRGRGGLCATYSQR